MCIAAPVFLPILLVVTATIFTRLLGWIVASIFGMGIGEGMLGSGNLWIGLAYNAVVAPPLFALLGRLRLYQQAEKERIS